DSGDSAGRKRCTTDRSSDARPNRSRSTRCGVRWDRLTDFPLVTKGIEEKENAVPVVFIDRFGQNFELLATDEVVDACEVVDLQNQRDAYSTVDRSTALDGFGSPVTWIVRHVGSTEKQGAIALTEMCVSQFGTLIGNGKHFLETEVTVESYGLLDVLDRQ